MSLNDSIYNSMKENQFQYWWFVARRRLIKKYLLRYGKEKKPWEILDIGAGYGVNVSMLKSFGVVDAVEEQPAMRDFLAQQGVREVYESHKLFGGNIKKKYTCVAMFDVLEHVEDDRAMLKTTYHELLSEKACCILTVPSYKFLWSPHDEIMGHRRRYEKKEIEKLLKDSGFINVRTSYFISLLFPVVLLYVLLMRANPKFNISAGLPHPVINFILKQICLAETLLPVNLSLPFGLSIIAYAEKG